MLKLQSRIRNLRGHELKTCNLFGTQNCFIYLFIYLFIYFSSTMHEENIGAEFLQVYGHYRLQGQ